MHCIFICLTFTFLLIIFFLLLSTGYNEKLFGVLRHFEQFFRESYQYYCSNYPDFIMRKHMLQYLWIISHIQICSRWLWEQIESNIWKLHKWKKLLNKVENIVVKNEIVHCNFSFCKNVFQSHLKASVCGKVTHLLTCTPYLTISFKSTF